MALLNARLAAIVQSSEDAIIGQSLEGIVESWNDAATRMYGYAADEAIGQHISIIAPPERKDEIPALLVRLRRGERVAGFVTDRIARSGRRLHVALTLSPILRPGGVVVGAASVARDITGQVRAEWALRESEALKRAVIESSLDAIVIMDAGGWIVELNPAAENLFGFTKGEAIGRDMASLLIPPRLRDRHRRGLARYLATGESQIIGRRVEMPALRADGSEVPVELTVVRVDLADPAAPALFSATVRDLTEQRQARFLSSRLAAIVASADDAIVWTELNGTVLSWNAAAERLYGYRADEMIGASVDRIAPADRKGEFRRLADRLLAGETVRYHKTERIRKDGVPVQIALTMSLVRLENGEVAGVSAIGRDITELQREMDARDAARTRLAAIVDASVDGIVGTTVDGLVTDWNPAAERIYGYAAGEVVGHEITEIIPADRVEERESLEARLQAGERIERFETDRVRKDGTRISVSLGLAPLPDSTGAIVGSTTIVRDITDLVEGERKRTDLEARLRQAERLETVGRLAAGITHDFNNVLTSVLGFAQLLGNEVPADDPKRAMAEAIEEAADRATALVRQLLAFSRQQVLRPEILELGDVIRSLTPMLERLIGEDVQISVPPAEGLWLIEVDRSQLEQVIVNLAVNARDAMPSGGRLTIETANADLDAEYARSHVEVTPGTYVMLAVSDTGAGMDVKTLARIFEPFFTTKAAGHGTGLGLATVYGIVRQSGGHIWVYSEPGRGTTFRVYFPRAVRPADAPVPPAPKQSEMAGTEAVLVAEDDKSLRALMDVVLTRLGYTVLVASDPANALELARNESIDLLLTDVVMPGQSGLELAQSLRALQPDLRVVYVSGYTAAALEHHGPLGGDDLLEKPFAPDALGLAVRRALDR